MSSLIPKELHTLATKIQKAQSSKNVQYFIAHEEELSRGYGLKQRYPYRKAAEDAYDRLMVLESQVYEIYESSSPEAQNAMSAEYPVIFEGL